MSTAIAAAAAAETSTGNTGLTITLFAVFVAITLGITIWASRQNRTAADFYAGGRQFTGMQNGLAIGGDYMSAASFLGIAGAIALNGYDGFLYSIGFLVAWLVALLLVAELMRNTGKFTMADVLSFRMRQTPVRTAAAISTVVVSIFYLLAQMVGAGSLVALLLNLSPTNTAAKNWVIVLVGVLMIVYVVFGGMKGTTWVQIVKAVLLMLGALAMTIWVLAKYNFNISSLLGAAHDQYAAIDGNAAKDFLAPGNAYGKTGTTKLDFISLALALVLGTAGLPHVLIRFYTVPDSKTARKSVNWAIGLIGVFYLMTLILGFGAAAIVGTLVIKTQNAAGNTAAPQLAGALGGSWMLAIISAVAFATILAVVAGLTLASSSSVAHDVYNNVIKKGKATDAQEVRVGRIAAVIIGAISIALAIPAQKLNVAFLVALAFAIAASANMPTILFSLYWKRFNTRGATWGIYGGLISTLVLLFFSPNVSGGAVDAKTGKAASLITNPDVDFSWFPLNNPGIVSIPLGFLFAFIGTVTAKEFNKTKWAEMEVRSLTGAHAEKAVKH